MNIISRRQAKFIKKPYGKAWQYLRPEYEVHYNAHFVKNTQTWHHHNKVAETLLILEGTLQLLWKEKGKLHNRIVRAGDLIETGRESHTFVNRTGKPVKLVVIKQVLTGRNKRRIFKADKFVDEAPW